MGEVHHKNAVVCEDAPSNKASKTSSVQDPPTLTSCSERTGHRAQGLNTSGYKSPRMRFSQTLHKRIHLRISTLLLGKLTHGVKRDIKYALSAYKDSSIGVSIIATSI